MRASPRGFGVYMDITDYQCSKRVFLLGPSHHHYLSGAATTACDKYATPLGDLIIDTSFVQEIKQEWGLETMSQDVDEAEHSLEMHLPYIYKMLSLYLFPNHTICASPTDQDNTDTTTPPPSLSSPS